MNEKSKSVVEVEELNVPLAHFPSGADGTEPAPKKRSDLEKMNNLLLERLRRIRRISDDAIMDVRTDEEHNKAFLAACTEIRQLVDFYKPREKPIDPTAPEMKVSKQEAFNRRTWSFCDGLFPIIHIDTPDGFMARCKINGRTFRESVVKEDLGELGQVWTGYIYDKDQGVTSVNGLGKGKNCVKLMTHAAFRAYVKQLSGVGKKYHKRKGFLRQNAARAKAAKEGK